MKDPNTLHLNIYGGNGDVLAITPSLKALKKQNPALNIVLHCYSQNHLNILANNPYVSAYQLAKKPKPFPAWLRRSETLHNIAQIVRNRLNKPKHRILNLSVGSMGTYTVYRKPMQHILADGLGVTLEDSKLEVHLTEEELELGRQLAEKYNTPIIINPTNKSRIEHVWPVERWNDVLARFPNQQFVQVGLPSEPLIKGAIDARKKGGNSLREAIALLKFARAYLGMDTFWQHAAAAVNTPGVVIHSDGHPAVFGHDLHINLYKALPCAPCMARLGNSPCPYNVECVTSIQIPEVVESLEKLLLKTHV